jgi:hypothetical protein
VDTHTLEALQKRNNKMTKQELHIKLDSLWLEVFDLFQLASTKQLREAESKKLIELDSQIDELTKLL